MQRSAGHDDGVGVHEGLVGTWVGYGDGDAGLGLGLGVGIMITMMMIMTIMCRLG